MRTMMRGMKQYTNAFRMNIEFSKMQRFTSAKKQSNETSVSEELLTIEMDVRNS